MKWRIVLPVGILFLMFPMTYQPFRERVLALLGLVITIKVTSVTGIQAGYEADLDPDGYRIWVVENRSPSSLDPSPLKEQDKQISADGKLWFHGLSDGMEYRVRLSDNASNCSVTSITSTPPSSPDLSDQSTVIQGKKGETRTVDFGVYCAPTSGDLALTISTTGVNVDDSYDVWVDGSSIGPIGSNALKVVPDLSVGGHQLTLSDLAGNCTNATIQSAGPPQPLVVSSGQTAPVPLTVVGGSSTQVKVGITCFANATLRLEMKYGYGPQNGLTENFQFECSGNLEVPSGGGGTKKSFTPSSASSPAKNDPSLNLQPVVITVSDLAHGRWCVSCVTTRPAWETPSDAKRIACRNVDVPGEQVFDFSNVWGNCCTDFFHLDNKGCVPCGG